MLPKLRRNRYFLLSDLVLLPVAAYLSFVLRLDGFDLQQFWSSFGLFAALVVVVTPWLFQYGGVYARYWPYASTEETLLLGGIVAAAAMSASGLSLLAASVAGNGLVIPRSVPFLFLLLALVATAGPRLAVRVGKRPPYQRRRSDRPRQVLIVGAGEAGRMMVRELQQNRQLGLVVVGLVDDDRAKQQLHIHDVPILGTRQDIPRLLVEHQVGQVIIAMPTAPGKVVREVRAMCERAGVQAKVMPGIYELIDGTVSVNQLRDVQIEDLLRRAPIQTDTAAVSDLLRGKRALITGGGGSIGSELCRQVMRCRPAELIILGHGENSIFAIENEMRKHLNALAPEGGASLPRVTAVLADIRFPERIRSVFEEYRPDIVFHAAAHKHVPLMERNPAEAITNNVLGTRNVLEAALAVDVDQFVMISTDKAVNPTSIMGASKRTAELLVHQAAQRSGKPYLAVRFGNVLGSRGSVVLTFKEQIAAGGPVTITHPDMVRFFMTIPEAVQLVLQAATLGKGGEVFVLDMGAPVKIMDLARDMIELSGLEVGRDIDIVCSGLRPGEKLFEELFIPGEEYRRTRHEKIFIAGNASSLIPSQLNEAVGGLAAAAHRDDQAEIIRRFRLLIPEFEPGQLETARVPEPLPKSEPVRLSGSLAMSA